MCVIDAVGLWSRTPTFFQSAVEILCNLSRKHLSSLDVKNKEGTVLFRKTAEILQRLHSVSANCK